MSWPIARCWAGRVTGLEADSRREADFERGLEYLYALRVLLPLPDLIDLMLWPHYRHSAAWIGANLAAWNAQLAILLAQCHQAVAPAEPPQIRLCAAPLAARFGLDGLCCWPTASSGALILLDLGTLHAQDWLLLLVHEYAHALCGRPGHDALFQQRLTALCLSLNLDLDLSQDLSLNLSQTASWSTRPAYPRSPDRLSFWLGEPQQQA
jgi:hypothetical protein